MVRISIVGTYDWTYEKPIMWSLNKGYPVWTKPELIILPDGTKRTDSSSFTDKEWEDSGWKVVDVPNYNDETHVCYWNRVEGKWDYKDINETEYDIDPDLS